MERVIMYDEIAWAEYKVNNRPVKILPDEDRLVVFYKELKKRFAK
jgi:hypothetical protein